MPAIGSIDSPLLADVQLPPSTSADSKHTWRDMFAYVRVSGPGCYAWQIDGTTFSSTIAFRVSAAPN